MATAFRDSRLYHPPLPLSEFPRDLNLEDATICQLWEDTGIPCVHVPCIDAKRTVVLFHGNAERITKSDAEHQTTDTMLFISYKLDAEVFCPEYPGYYASSGPPSEEALVNAGVRFITALKDRPLVIVGYSLGCSVAVHAAKVVPDAPLLLIAPFASALSVGMRNLFGIGMWLAPLWRQLDVFVMSESTFLPEQKVFIASCEQDGIIHGEHAQRILKFADRSKAVGCVFAGENHHTILHCETVYDSFTGFMGTET